MYILALYYPLMCMRKTQELTAFLHRWSLECSILEVMKSQEYFNIETKNISVTKDNREYCSLTICHCAAYRYE